MNFYDFIKNVVYPYFANQIYKENRGIYAAEEYLHGFDGITQFYCEELNICNSKLAIDILKGILSKELPGRNDPCFCCKTKYKYCHLNSVEFLRSIPEERLISDLDGFYKLAENVK